MEEGGKLSHQRMHGGRKKESGDSPTEAAKKEVAVLVATVGVCVCA